MTTTTQELRDAITAARAADVAEGEAREACVHGRGNFHAWNSAIVRKITAWATVDNLLDQI